MTGIELFFSVIDAVNAADPNDFDGAPLALAQGRMAEEWTRRLDPTASDALRLAARAHHLRRWAVPRDSYPEGRPGYLRWRRDQKTRHAAELSTMLLAEGAQPELVTRTTQIVRKVGLGDDPEVQTFEDAVSLTFVQTQFASTAERVGDDDRMVEIVAMTLRKMSPAGHEAAGTIALDLHSARIVERAIAGLD